MGQQTGTISWVHFGDLHIRGELDENYSDFLALIDEANENLAGQVDFAFLPGDNADDGTEAECELVRRAVQRLRVPVEVITGDHDRKAGTLGAYQEYLERTLYRGTTIRNFRLLFLNAMDGDDAKTFDFGEEQFEWLKRELVRARDGGLRPLVFVHLYPSELSGKGQEFSRLIREYGVEMVDMGHTHYNELANDGCTIYAATRSTGQIEEGPPGFSVTVIDEDAVSWKFKERGAWPFVMIASPSDCRLVRDAGSPRQVVRGEMIVRARAWDARGIGRAACSVDGAAPVQMELSDGSTWQCAMDSCRFGDGVHTVRVEVNAGNARAEDEIRVLVDGAGSYRPPMRKAVDYDNTIGAWPEKGILGTQLGPNENGTKGPWPSWRGR